MTDQILPSIQPIFAEITELLRSARFAMVTWEIHSFGKQGRSGGGGGVLRQLWCDNPASVRISELNLNVLRLSSRATFEFQTNNVIRLFIDYSFQSEFSIQ